jgi:predicted transcriptional regulator
MAERPKRLEETVNDEPVVDLDESEIIAALQLGLDDIKAGRVIPLEQAMRLLREELFSPKV